MKRQSLLFVLICFWCCFLLFFFAEVAYYIEHRQIYFLEKDEAAQNLPGLRRPLSFAAAPHGRILTLGGSTTYGMGLPAESTWPQLMENKLQGEHPGVELVNLALLGASIEEFILNFEHQAPRRYLREDFLLKKIRPAAPTHAGQKELAPQLVIIAPQINDLAPDLFYALQVQSLGEWWPVVKLGQNWALGFYLKRFLLRSRLPPTEGAVIRQKILALIGPKAEEMERNLSQLVDLWSPQARVILVQFPTLFNTSDQLPEITLAQSTLGPQRPLAEWVQEKEILSLTEAYDQKTMTAVGLAKKVPYYKLFWQLKSFPFRARLAYYLDAIHLGEKGHAAIAQELAQHLGPYVSTDDSKKLGGEGTLSHVRRK